VRQSSYSVAMVVVVVGTMVVVAVLVVVSGVYSKLPLSYSYLFKKNQAIKLVKKYSSGNVVPIGMTNM